MTIFFYNIHHVKYLKEKMSFRIDVTQHKWLLNYRFEWTEELWTVELKFRQFYFINLVSSPYDILRNEITERAQKDGKSTYYRYKI